MSIRFVITATLMMSVLFARGQSEADPAQAPFARLSGKELTQQLTAEKSRSRAFYELMRRAGTEKDSGKRGQCAKIDSLIIAVNHFV